MKKVNIINCQNCYIYNGRGRRYPPAIYTNHRHSVWRRRGRSWYQRRIQYDYPDRSIERREYYSQSRDNHRNNQDESEPLFTQADVEEIVLDALVSLLEELNIDLSELS